MARSRHPNKEIEAALKYAESRGWRVVMSKRGHRWATIYCPSGTRDGCQWGVSSTPKNPQEHAKGLRRKVHQCACGAEGE